MRRCLVVGLCLAFNSSCSDPTQSGRTRVPACDPVFGFQVPDVMTYYLTQIDGTDPPRELTFGAASYQIAAGQLALDLTYGTYLTAFYTDAGSPRFGISIIGGQSFAEQPDGTLHLLVNGDTAQVFGIVTFSTDSLSLNLITTELPELENALDGTHTLQYFRCT